MQLKKVSNAKLAAELSEPSETVEQGSGTNESDGENNAEELTVGTAKEIEVLENSVIENGREKSLATAQKEKKGKFLPRERGRKRKFPSRDEISKAR